MGPSLRRPAASLVEVLREQERAWEAKPLLRDLYADWFARVRRELAPLPGPTVELGCGIGRFKEAVPWSVATDVEPTPWAEGVVDAEALPYGDGSVANLVLNDTFHHLARPARFLDEAGRVLVPGGRVVVLDPYCSPFSTFVYRRFHHERTDLRAPALEDDPRVGAHPLAANQARATLAFFRERAAFEARWPQLWIVARRRLALVLYPLSGGFSRRQVLPGAAVGPVRALERALRPLAPMLAFRCLVVLEHRPRRNAG